MIKFFVNRSLFTSVIFVFLFLIGGICFSILPLDFLPNIDLPAVTIIATYPGANAQDVEMMVTKVIEDSVSTAANIDRIESNSQENLSLITIYFNWGIDLDTATNDVRDKLDLVRRQLPKDIDPPTIVKFDISSVPVLVFGISAKESAPDLYHIVDKQISNELKRINGVGSCSIIGGRQRQVKVELDRDAFQARNITIQQIIGMLAASNLNMPAGTLQTRTLGFALRTPGEYANIDEVGNTIVGSYQNRPVYLKDVAKVYADYEDNDCVSKVDGNLGISLSIQKQSGSNTLQVISGIYNKLEQIKKIIPADIKIVPVQDSSENIYMSVDNLYETLMFAFLFVVVVLLFFLRKLTSSLIVTLSIPCSLVAAFTYLYVSGASLNIISLSSLAIALGLVVDDAIVVIDNITRHQEEKGESQKDAAIFAPGEVASAVIASTVTNMAIFIPMALVTGFVSIFFGQLSYTIVVVLLASLLCAMSLVPLLCSRFLRVDKTVKQNKYALIVESWFVAMEEKYNELLNWALTHRARIILIGALMFLASLPLFVIVPKDLFPTMDLGSIQMNVQMPVGTHWTETARVADKVQAIIKENVPELRYMLIRAGADTSSSSIGSAFGGMKTGPNIAFVQLRLVPESERKRSTTDIQHLITQKILTQVPGVELVDLKETGGVNQAMGINKPLSIEIYGDDFDESDQMADKVSEIVKSVKGTINVTISRDKGNPEYWIKVDRDKAALAGITISDVAQTMRSSVYGYAATKFRSLGDEYDIFVRLKESQRKKLEDIQALNVYSNVTKMGVPLLSIASIDNKLGPLNIQRKNQNRVVKVEANLYDRSLSEVVKDVKKEMTKLTIPANINIKYGGAQEQMGKTFSSLGLMLLLGIILVYLVMVAQFESVIDPLIIMLSVPFGVCGVIWGLLLTNTPFDVMSFSGLIMVVGIVVKNAIVLVDFTNILRERGMELYAAVKAAGRSRLRPVLMTATVAILALIPMSIVHGEGGEMWAPLGRAVIGGLLVSTVVTLVFVPVAYSLVEEKIRRKK
jgi:HAE1 family hydrophobic/amphiphilic exporter-1